MDEERLRRFASQIRKTAGGAGGRPPAGALAGGSLLLAVIGGGVLLASSLVNGAYSIIFCWCYSHVSQSTVATEQSNTRGAYSVHSAVAPDERTRPGYPVFHRRCTPKELILWLA